MLYLNPTFVPLNLSLLYQLIRSTMTTKKWNLKVNNHPVFEFLVIEQILLQFFSEIRYSILKLVEVHLPKRRRKPKLSFVLVCSETNLWRTNQCNTNDLVRLSQVLSRSNGNLRFRFCFRLSLGTWTGYSNVLGQTI